MEEELKYMFIHEKPVKILVKLQSPQEYYASALSTEIDATYSHTVKILQRLEEYELVEFEERGRKKIVTLTERGAKLAKIFTELMDEFEPGPSL